MMNLVEQVGVHQVSVGESWQWKAELQQSRHSGTRW